MRNQFDRQLNTLNGELIQMGHMVEQAIEHAIEAMVHQDAEKARKNMEFDSEVDQQEKDIETLCMKLLMKQQPVARDLRLISAALKMITDMERIGDQAADISELSLSLVNEKNLPMMDRMKQMSQECMLMVMKGLEAFVAKDIEMAKKVIARDDVIDAMFDDIKKEDKVYLLVAHNGISRAIESYVRDMSNEEFAGFGIKNCELRKYEF